MSFYNLTGKELNKTKSCFDYGTKDYFEIDLIDMVDSVYCYDNYGKDYDKYLNNKYINAYYLDTSYTKNGARLPKEVVEEITKKRVDYLCENTTIKHDVFTDSEGVTYNSLVFNEEV